MLIEFSVKNYLSFKDKVTFSMEKGIGNELHNNFFSFNENIELLNTAAIYGANASGKTNLIKALAFSILFVRNSSMKPLGEKIGNAIPFLFDEESKNQKSDFEFIFIANKIKYKYFFSVDSSRVYDESLDAYYTQKPTNIFKRTNTNNYIFNSDKGILEEISKKNTDNKLFLATATTWNYDKTRDAFLWFCNSINTYSNLLQLNRISPQLYSDDEELRKFAIKILRNTDILINNISVDYEEKELFTSFPDSLNNQINRGGIKVPRYKIELEHEVIDEQNEKHYYSLDLSSESSGTQVLFAFIPFLRSAFKEQQILIVDELEKSIHPIIVEKIVELFNNENINVAKSQLIFTTHAVNLLNLDLLRRDQIWFTEKNSKNGSSDLYCLDSFSVNKKENIQKGYINGRYGAIPFVKDVDLWLDKD